MLKKIATSAALTAAATVALMTASPAYAHHDVVTSGNGSVLSGNQLVAKANVPVNVCGNAIAVLGNAGASCKNSGANVVY